MARKYAAIVERGKDGWYISEVVELPGCHTQAKSLRELKSRTKEAIIAYTDNDALIQLKLSLEDLYHGRVKKFNLKSS